MSGLWGKKGKQRGVTFKGSTNRRYWQVVYWLERGGLLTCAESCFSFTEPRLLFFRCICTFIAKSIMYLYVLLTLGSILQYVRTEIKFRQTIKHFKCIYFPDNKRMLDACMEPFLIRRKPFSSFSTCSTQIFDVWSSRVCTHVREILGIREAFPLCCSGTGKPLT